MSRILLLTHEYEPCQGGVATDVAGLAEAASCLGHDVSIACPDYGQSNHPAANQLPYRMLRFPGGVFKASRHLFPFARRILQLVRSGAYDIVHGADSGAQMALQFLSLCGLSVGPYFLTVHGSELGLYTRYRRYRWLMRTMFDYATHTIAVSYYTRSLITQFAPDVAPQRVSVVHHGVGPEWLAPPAAGKRELRRLHQIAGDALVVLSVSRLVAEKGHEVVIEALALLPESLRRNILYLVVGEGEFESRIRDAASARAVRLILAGARAGDALRRYYDMSDVFVLLTHPTPTFVESFGLVYIEAAARGLPPSA